ncbi:hypothetical protein D9M71_740290 [compost metagenome]
MDQGIQRLADMCRQRGIHRRAIGQVQHQLLDIHSHHDAIQRQHLRTARLQQRAHGRPCAAGSATHPDATPTPFHLPSILAHVQNR